MATVSNTKFGIFKPHKQDFEEGELSSDNPLNRSSSPTLQENPPGSKEQNQKLDGNFDTKKELVPKSSNSTGSTSCQDQRTFLGRPKEDFTPPQNKFRSPQNSGGRKNDENRERSQSSLYYYHPQQYGYGYHQYPPFHHPREHFTTNDEKHGKNQKRQSEYPQGNYGHYQSQFEYRNYAVPRISPPDSHTFHEGKNRGAHPSEFNGVLSSELNSPGVSASDCTENKYYKEKQNRKNRREQEKAKGVQENPKQMIQAFKRFFKPQEWDNLTQIIQQLVQKNNNGFEKLLNFLEKYQGRRKIRKSLKVFEMLVQLELEGVMDKLIEQERAQRMEENKNDKIKVLLRQLTRPLNLSG